MTVAGKLYDYFDGKTPYHLAFECDLFGKFNWTINMQNNCNETITMFLGLYKGLYLMNVSCNEIHKCFLQNKLDILIHEKYKLRKSGYYKMFCENDIKIGDTCLHCDDSDDNNSDDNNSDNDIPDIYTKIIPPYTSHTEIPCILNLDCIDDNNINKIINKKISAYKAQDEKNKRDITSEEYVSAKDVKDLFVKQDYKCYICCDTVIIAEWQSKCLYQFTLDRINNKLPHLKNNILVSCYYCNCFGYIDIGDDIYTENICLYKLCTNGCHTIKREKTRSKYDVTKKEIDELILNT